jgi:regulator of sirC expression with transglutaminase-like and TPR domain
VLFDRHGYAGDQTTYNDLQNANLMSVIDRRRDLPIALGILYIHAARAQGWSIEGINFPGHFLLRLRDGAAAAIVDPFNGGRVCAAEDLRELVKAVEGETAELRPAHFQPAGNRQMLLRLQNNIKLRLLRGERVPEAAAVVERMLLVAPDEPGLWHEAGVLQGRLGNLRAAVSALENLVALCRGSENYRAATRLLADMKARLN